MSNKCWPQLTGSGVAGSSCRVVVGRPRSHLVTRSSASRLLEHGHGASEPGHGTARPLEAGYWRVVTANHSSFQMSCSHQGQKMVKNAGSYRKFKSFVKTRGLLPSKNDEFHENAHFLQKKNMATTCDLNSPSSLPNCDGTNIRTITLSPIKLSRSLTEALNLVSLLFNRLSKTSLSPQHS